ncbi:unnamed protein product [Lactuca saligna]|uniref:Uncharacterized protein n=1 Tax=Lactuca saligna TaxID=75948 RepID=A0AA35ZXJ0_LACSI|nr:unnamed protein product [Lactuca saligna]
MNASLSEDDLHIILRMQKWITKPYVVESSASEEEDYEDDGEQNGSTPPLMQTIEPLIQLVISPRSASPSPQPENVPPMPTPIQNVTVYQGESNSNFETTTLSQLSLHVNITRSLGERVTIVEKDVTDMKRFMVLGDDDDDMIIDDTPPNSLETNDYEGFLEIGFMPQADVSVVPLNVVYPESYFEGEIPHGTNSDIGYDNDQLNPRKRKASLSGEPMTLKLKALLLLGVREITIENNATIRERKEVGKGERLFAKLAQALASADVQSINNQVKKIQIFNNGMGKKNRVLELNDRINRKKFGDVLTRRTNPDPIIRVRYTKPRNKYLKLHLVRKNTEYEYTEVVFARELVKFGYNDWIQIQEIINKHKGSHAQEVTLAIQQLLNKVKKLNRVPSLGPSRPSTPGRPCAPRQSNNTKFLLLYGTRYINNKLPTGVEPIQYMFIRELEHSIFYLDGQNYMCFQYTDELPAAPTKHLFHLRMEGLSHFEHEREHCVLISLEISKRLEELKNDDFEWVKHEILKKPISSTKVLMTLKKNISFDIIR